MIYHNISHTVSCDLEFSFSSLTLLSSPSSPARLLFSVYSCWVSSLLASLSFSISTLKCAPTCATNCPILAVVSLIFRMLSVILEDSKFSRSVCWVLAAEEDFISWCYSWAGGRMLSPIPEVSRAEVSTAVYGAVVIWLQLAV